VSYGGQPLREDSLAARTEIAAAGEVTSTYPDLTVREHLLLVAVAHGWGRKAPGIVDRAIAECRLTDHQDALPGSLSSGQRQALQLAAVLVRPRRLLIHDEPEQGAGSPQAGQPRVSATSQDGRDRLGVTWSA
jgi:ABC-2 type transport system ATP-binding protein